MDSNMTMYGQVGSERVTLRGRIKGRKIDRAERSLLRTILANFDFQSVYNIVLL